DLPKTRPNEEWAVVAEIRVERTGQPGPAVSCRGQATAIADVSAFPDDGYHLYVSARFQDGERDITWSIPDKTPAGTALSAGRGRWVGVCCCRSRHAAGSRSKRRGSSICVGLATAGACGAWRRRSLSSAGSCRNSRP